MILLVRKYDLKPGISMNFADVCFAKKDILGKCIVSIKHIGLKIFQMILLNVQYLQSQSQSPETLNILYLQ